MTNAEAPDELMRGSRERRSEWDEWMRAEGLDPDRMSEDEIMDYVDRIIHEHREEERQRGKERAGEDS